MELKRVLPLLAFAVPLFGQYAGPAILSRGQAPSAMEAPEIDFRPHVAVYALYDTGLANVSVTNDGSLAHEISYGVGLDWGVSGVHSWRHTKLGLDYSGGVSHYPGSATFDNLSQSFLMGISHQLKRHVTFSLRQSMGLFSRDNGRRGLQQTVPFDPTTTYAPTTDFFDNRTIFLSTQADLIIQKSARLSFDLGGDAFVTHRRSKALAGVIGGSGRADVAYRWTKFTTVGALYTYTHYDFTRIFGGSDLHGAAITLAHQFTRTLEFSGFGGFYRVESKFVQNVPIDPVIAALLGITSATQVTHPINFIPNYSGRLSRTFQRGVLYIAAGHTVVPGNGLFQTSYSTNELLGYTYTGLRRWSFSASVEHDSSSSQGSIHGSYGSTTGGMQLSRNLGRTLHMVVAYSARRYDSPDFSQYNRLIHSVSAGLAFAPGDVPLRLW